MKYYKDDQAKVYYVGKSSLRKLGDYSIRMFAVPVTVVLDAAPAILVVGAIVMGKGTPGPGFLNDSRNNAKRQQDETQVFYKIKNDDLPIPGTNSP
ncbi:MAG: hypothetical protein PHW60_02650 [Kiritimatiellae bacterium]|nr:hypothetical protein [Kiritimatiellia bacterium]